MGEKINDIFSQVLINSWQYKSSIIIILLKEQKQKEEYVSRNKHCSAYILKTIHIEMEIKPRVFVVLIKNELQKNLAVCPTQLCFLKVI